MVDTSIIAVTNLGLILGLYTINFKLWYKMGRINGYVNGLIKRNGGVSK